MKLFKSNKTLNKVLAGMGIATAIPLVAGLIGVNVGGNALKAVEGIGAYAVGGIESVAGALVPMFLGPMARPSGQAGSLVGGTL